MTSRVRPSTGPNADVAVVGAGVVGVSIALELQARGLGAVVLDRAGVAAGQSGVQPGGVRLQWGSAINCSLARESLAWWRQAPDRLSSSVRLGFTACGYLFVAHSQAVLEGMGENVRAQNAEGVPSRIVDPSEAAALVPGLDVSTIVGAAWCADDGYVDHPQAMIEAMAQQVDVRVTEVQALHRTGASWTLETRDGRVEADTVVLAAGIETKRLLAPLGIDLPVASEARHLFLSSPIRKRLLEPLVVSGERRFAAKQLYSGRVLASDLSASGDPEVGAARWKANIREAISELLPVLEYADFTVLVSGEYDITPDRQPILGPVPGYDGLHVATGFSGHGFMIAPAVSRIVAGAVLGEHDPTLDVMDAGRFAAQRLVPEPQVI